jgi:hypothetical protein
MGISSALGSQALLPAGLGFRNAIINGDFSINQRGFSSTTTSGTYGFDRWRISSAGGTVTYSAQSFTAGNAIPGQEPTNFARVVTASQSASSHLSIFNQAIESVRTFAGQSVTISFWAKAGSGTPKVSIELAQNFGTGGSPSSTVFSYVNQATLSTSWARYIFTFLVPSISGKTIGTNNDHFLSLNMWTSAGSDFNSRTGSIGIQNSTIDFWGVQVEQNLQPTPFEQRPIGIELALCQRYFWKHLSGGGISYLSFNYAGVQYRLTIPHPVQMRSNPHTVTTSGWQGGSTPSISGANVLSSNWVTAAGWFYVDGSTSIEISSEL